MKIRLLIFPITFTFLSACQQHTQNNEKNDDNRDYAIEKEDTLLTEPDNQIEEEYAIGNIAMNISREEFEEEKKIFLNNHPKLGDLAIKTIKGFFYKERLAVIEIISVQQDIHKNNIESNESFGGWQTMYKTKYNLTTFHGGIHLFSFEEGSNGLPTFEKNS